MKYYIQYTTQKGIFINSEKLFIPSPKDLKDIKKAIRLFNKEESLQIAKLIKRI